MPVLTKFHALRDALRAETINRHDEIDALLTALVGRSHVFLLSKPGTGKTMLVDRTMARIGGAEKFTILLSKFTADQEVLGPWSLPDLRVGKYHRLVDNYLPTAHVAFIDEIWKGSSALTNALLGATNERRIRNGDDVLDIPLSTLVCASNELPSDEHDQCAAIYDRLDLRLEVADVTDPADLFALLRLNIDPNPAPVLDWSDVATAQAYAAALPVSEAASWAIVDMYRKLADQGIRVSPRRLRRAEVVARAAAWLDGAREVETHHLEVLRHMFWDAPEQRAAVERVVLEVASPLQREVLDVTDTVTGLSEQLDGALKLDEADPARSPAILEIRKKVERAMGTALDLEDRATGRAAATLADTVRRMETLHSTMAFELAGVTGGKSLADTLRAKR